MTKMLTPIQCPMCPEVYDDLEDYEFHIKVHIRMYKDLINIGNSDKGNWSVTDQLGREIDKCI